MEEADRHAIEEIENRFLNRSRRAQIVKDILAVQLSVLDSQTDELGSIDAIIKDASTRIDKLWDAIETGTIDTATAGEKIKAQQARMEAAEARKKDIGQKVRHIFLTEARWFCKKSSISTRSPCAENESITSTSASTCLFCPMI